MLRDNASEMAAAPHLGACLLQWPSGSMNGYAYYHRVDQVNGGDMNHTHTTGFSKKEGFWCVAIFGA